LEAHHAWSRLEASESIHISLATEIDVDSTPKQPMAKAGRGGAWLHNSHKRGAPSYNPQLAFCAATKEILQGWMRCGDAYTYNGIIDKYSVKEKLTEE